MIVLYTGYTIDFREKYDRNEEVYYNIVTVMLIDWLILTPSLINLSINTWVDCCLDELINLFITNIVI